MTASISEKGRPFVRVQEKVGRDKKAIVVSPLTPEKAGRVAERAGECECRGLFERIFTDSIAGI